MIGKRIIVDKEMYPHEMELLLQPGEYAKSEKFPELGWLLCAPNGALGFVRPPIFTIDVHEDGTITVGPASILFGAAGDKPEWHGYLHKGVWS